MPSWLVSFHLGKDDLPAFRHRSSSGSVHINCCRDWHALCGPVRRLRPREGKRPFQGHAEIRGPGFRECPGCHYFLGTGPSRRCLGLRVAWWTPSLPLSNEQGDPDPAGKERAWRRLAVCEEAALPPQITKSLFCIRKKKISHI